MTLRENFLEMKAERRNFAPDSLEYQWRTRAARKYVWMLRGVPPREWKT